MTLRTGLKTLLTVGFISLQPPSSLHSHSHSHFFASLPPPRAPLRHAHACAVIQVLSRYWALWGIVEQAPEAIKTGSVKLLTVGDFTLQLNLLTLLFAWSTTEILRYGFYAAKVC